MIEVSDMVAAAERADYCRNSGEFICCALCLKDGALVVRAVSLQPGWWFDANSPLGDCIGLFYRWRSRQAAHQWLQAHLPYAGLRVLRLSDWLSES